ncbi:hypothetical protein LTR13_010931 [Exophiala sideris]|uniref:Uncharacterized protein n=1 Tax=Exophiala sideris TaxID=1016849 RepID=A0ABR0IWG7_9EURO|nr:hypothetical protein LTR13_010931 [Exophiala sideris]KAK5049164.1 hypothetical protein LTR69_011128 [Exophiala sideris]KAK5176475.1 hypothetical protein LTR44_010953 [Eurotiomycetes sp. CCFEE 6388]
MSRLFERLDSLPVELEDLFMQIIESINVPEPADATKIFQIVMAKPQWQRTFLTLSHTLEEHADYALNLVSHALTKRALKHRISLMRRRLNSRFKGVDVEKRALTLTLSVVDWASHKERDTKSPPSHLLAVLRHMMVERLPHCGIHKLAKSLEREACEAPGAFYIFKRWE